MSKKQQRKDNRAAKKQAKFERKETRKDNRANRRQSVRNNRLDAKTERVALRQQSKQDKWSAFEVAYENGIDPRKGMLEGVGTVISSSGQAASDVIGSLGQSQSQQALAAQGINPFGSNSSMPMMLLLGFLALFMFKS